MTVVTYSPVNALTATGLRYTAKSNGSAFATDVGLQRSCIYCNKYFPDKQLKRFTLGTSHHYRCLAKCNTAGATL